MRDIDTIVIHHTASKAENHTWADIRQWHLKKGWNDIGYHYGIVFDDKKWQVKRGRPVEEVGAHAKGFNTGSIGVVFEGNYSTSELPDEALELGAGLIAELRRTFTIKRICGHRDLPYPTECPGSRFPLKRLLNRATEVLRGLETPNDGQ